MKIKNSEMKTPKKKNLLMFSFVNFPTLILILILLLAALKHKGVNATPSSQVSSNLPSAQTRDTNNSHGKPPKPTLEKFDTETDFYGYYFNRYNNGTTKNK